MLYGLWHGEFGHDWYALRAIGALLTAFLIAALGGVPLVAWLRRKGIGEQTDKTPIEDEELVEQIRAKAGTPTMGGLLIAAAFLPACLLWGRLSDRSLWLGIGCFVALGALGMVDDWKKLTGRGHKQRGLKVRYKLLIQGAVGCALGAAVVAGLAPEAVHRSSASLLSIPWFTLSGGLLAVVWFALVIATMSNAVNVTDGLDGLAGGLTVIALVPLGVAAAGERSELCVHCGALGGAVLGFLRYNRHPARLFMGDTGSLAIGGSLGLLALLTYRELLLPLIGFVFLVEFGSVVLQVLWFKATGRRILPIAPVHHIFQKKGWPETQIVARFLIVGVLAAGSALLLM